MNIIKEILNFLTTSKITKLKEILFKKTFNKIEEFYELYERLNPWLSNVKNKKKEISKQLYKQSFFKHAIPWFKNLTDKEKKNFIHLYTEHKNQKK